MKKRVSKGLVVVILAVSGATLCRPPTPTVAKVEVPSYATVAADETTVKEIIAAFDRAEQAIQARDLDGLMNLYSKRYNYHKLRKSDARRMWEEILEYHQKLHSTHLFTDIKTTQVDGETRAEVKCTGALWGVAGETGQKVTVDSWFEEVHYLVKEDGTGASSATRERHLRRLASAMRPIHYSDRGRGCAWRPCGSVRSWTLSSNPGLRGLNPKSTLCIGIAAQRQKRRGNRNRKV